MIANKQLILLDNLSTLEKQKSILNSLKEMEKLIQQKEQVAIITNEEYICTNVYDAGKCIYS